MDEIHPSVYILAIIIAGFAILGAFLSVWLISAASIILLVIFLFFAKNTEISLNEIKNDRMRMLQIIIKKIDTFSEKLDATKTELARHVYSINSRASEREIELERNMRELAGKILQVENNLNEVKRTLRYEERM